MDILEKGQKSANMQSSRARVLEKDRGNYSYHKKGL